MRVIREERQLRTLEVVESITCDRCGKECLAKPGRFYEREGAEFCVNFGYGSRFDDETWRIDMCDDCAGWLKGEFKAADYS